MKTNAKKTPPKPKAKPRAKKLVPPPTRTEVADQELTVAAGHVEFARQQVEKARAHLSGLLIPGSTAITDSLASVERMLKDARYTCLGLRGKCASDQDFAERRGHHDACGGGK